MVILGDGDLRMDIDDPGQISADKIASQANKSPDKVVLDSVGTIPWTEFQNCSPEFEIATQNKGVNRATSAFVETQESVYGNRSMDFVIFNCDQKKITPKKIDTKVPKLNKTTLVNDKEHQHKNTAIGQNRLTNKNISSDFKAQNVSKNDEVGDIKNTSPKKKATDFIGSITLKFDKVPNDASKLSQGLLNRCLTIPETQLTVSSAAITEICDPQTDSPKLSEHILAESVQKDTQSRNNHRLSKEGLNYSAESQILLTGTEFDKLGGIHSPKRQNGNLEVIEILDTQPECISDDVLNSDHVLDSNNVSNSDSDSDDVIFVGETVMQKISNNDCVTRTNKNPLNKPKKRTTTTQNKPSTIQFSKKRAASDSPDRKITKFNKIRKISKPNETENTNQQTALGWLSKSAPFQPNKLVTKLPTLPTDNNEGPRFLCEVCSASYKTRSDLNRHVKSKH